MVTGCTISAWNSPVSIKHCAEEQLFARASSNCTSLLPAEASGGSHLDPTAIDSDQDVDAPHNAVERTILQRYFLGDMIITFVCLRQN